MPAAEDIMRFTREAEYALRALGFMALAGLALRFRPALVGAVLAADLLVLAHSTIHLLRKRYSRSIQI